MLSPEELERIVPLIENLVWKMHQALNTDDEVYRAVNLIEEAGYDIKLVTEVIFSIMRKEAEPQALPTPKPLVKNGEVIPEAYSRMDTSFLKAFKIKL